MTAPAHIEPAVHEADVFLWFADNGLSPYWAIRNLLIHEFDGHGKVTTEIGGDHWNIDLAYSDSGIAPRPSDAVERDVLRDFELHVSGPGQMDVHYQIRARFDDMRGPNGEERSIPWRGGEGLDVHTQSSNISLEALPQLLRRALDELAEEAGTSFNHRYFRRVLPESSVTTLELYVRMKRQYGRKLVRSDGVLYRLMHLLSGQRGLEWVYSADNTEIIGHRHAFDLPPSAAAELAPDHQFGKRAKCYHPKHVRDEETQDDPLSSPKFGVAFHKSLNGHARPWSKRDELIHELEETLINMLRWSDVPAEPDPTCFVSDWHFGIGESDRDIADLADPTPQIEAEQESVLLNVLGELTPTAQDAAKHLATDGGMHYEKLAEKTDSSISTIYRVIDQFGDAVKSDRGEVKFTSEKIRQEIIGLVDRLEELKESTAERVAELANVDLRSRADSALQKWMAKYGAEIVDIDTDDFSGTIRFDVLLSKFRADDNPRMADALQEGLDAWTSTGRDALLFKELRVDADVRGGTDGQRVGSIIGW